VPALVKPIAFSNCKPPFRARESLDSAHASRGVWDYVPTQAGSLRTPEPGQRLVRISAVAARCPLPQNRRREMEILQVSASGVLQFACILRHSASGEMSVRTLLYV
jgi:hypothetical protein